MEYRLLSSTESSQFSVEFFDVNLTVAVSPIETVKISESGFIYLYHIHCHCALAIVHLDHYTYSPGFD